VSASPGQMTTEGLWIAFSTSLRSFFVSRGVGEATADDLVQETFERIHQKLETLQDEARVGPWIYRIARNRLIDLYRRRGKELVELPAEIEDQGQEQDETYNHVVGAWLRATIDEMPHNYRAALRLVEIEGKTQTEASEVLGLSVSGTKSRIQRGRKLLRQKLHKCCELELDSRGNVIELAARGSECC
jgi:RNA polymerase sigma-70 factor (ECF subfamily)